MPRINCFDTLSNPGIRKLKDEFDKLVTEGMSEAQQREIGTKIATDYHKQLDIELLNFKKSLGIKSEPYQPIDNTAAIEKIKSEYQLKIDEEKAKPIAPEKPEITNEKEQAPPPAEPPKPPIDVVGEGGEKIGITHEALDNLGKELGFSDYEKTPQTVEQWDIEARQRIEKGEFPKVLDKLRKGEPTDHVEVRMLLQYVADLKAKFNKDPMNNKILSDLKEAKDLISIHNSEKGRGLRALQGEKPVSENLEDWMMEKMESTGVDDLTQKQKEEVKQQFDEYKAKADAADAKQAEMQAEISKLKAELEVAKNKKKAIRKMSQENLIKERKEIIDNIKDKLKKSRGETSAVVIPYAKELFIIAPDVAKLVRNLATDASLKLEDFIDNIHDVLKGDIPDIRKEDVRDLIAGVYNKERPTLSEVNQRLRDVRDEAKLLKQLEDLMNGEPTTEKKQVERNKRIKELQGKIRDFKEEKIKSEKELEEKPEPTSPEDKALSAIKKRNETAAKKLEERITNKEYDIKREPPLNENMLLKKANPKLWRETMDAIEAKEEARNKFDLSKRQDELKNRSWWQRTGGFLGKLVTTSKAIKAGIDDSTTGVQLLMAILANPKKAVLAKWEAIQDINAKRFKRELTALHESPQWELIKNSGLEISEPQSHARANVEELYSGNLLDQKIGGRNYWTYSGGIFERIFTSFGNNLRLKMFAERVNYLEGKGKTFDTHPMDYKDAARAINEMTAKGKVNEAIQPSMSAISPIIWAPKMMASSLNTLGISDLAFPVLRTFNLTKTKGYYHGLTPEARKYAAFQMGQGIGTGISIMVALAVAGWDVDDDPTSVTFGTVKKGTKSYNVFGRFSATARTLTQIVTGQKETPTGGEIDLDEKQGRGSVLGRYFRGKMTPFAGLGYDYVFNSQKNMFTREDITIKTLPRELLEPISVGDLKKGWQQDGSITLLTRFLPAFEGIQVTDERDFAAKQGKVKIKNYNDGGRDITDKEFEDYTKKKEERLQQSISDLDNGTDVENVFLDGKDRKFFKKFKDMTEDEQKRAMTNIKTRTTKEIKEELFGAYEKTDDEKEREKILKEEKEYTRDSILYQKQLKEKMLQ